MFSIFFSNINISIRINRISGFAFLFWFIRIFRVLTFWDFLYHPIESYIHCLWCVWNSSCSLSDKINCALNRFANQAKNSFSESYSTTFYATLFGTLDRLYNYSSYCREHICKHWLCTVCKTRCYIWGRTLLWLVMFLSKNVVWSSF